MAPFVAGATKNCYTTLGVFRFIGAITYEQFEFILFLTSCMQFSQRECKINIIQSGKSDEKGFWKKRKINLFLPFDINLTLLAT